MNDTVISVEGLSKRYQLGRKQKHRNFGEACASALSAPFKRLIGRGEVEGEEFWALKDVNFEVQRGDVVGIIGRNGAGKSTLLKILSHITPPTTGSITLHGRVASLLEVGTGFHPELTGRENIFLNGAMLGMRREEIRRKFDEIVAFSEVEKFLDTPVKRYSSGMYVRLAFAVAAHLEPEILIVDEVLAVGDVQFQKKCLGKMQEVSSGSGRTVLFVSHNMAAIRSLCTKGILLKTNSPIETGSADEVVGRYMALVNQDSLGICRDFSKPAKASLWMESASIKVANSAARPVRMGDALTIQVQFSSDSPIRNVGLGWVLTNSDGIKLLCANNHYQCSTNMNVPSARGCVTCALDAVPLMPGYYTVSLYFGSGRVDSHVEYDAIGFHVEEFDVWGHGRIPPLGASAMYWPCHFEVRGTELV